jgi:hypothetical protein
MNATLTIDTLPKFQLGRIVATRGVADLIESDDIFAAFVSSSFARHASGDWGDVCKDDKQTNEDSLRHDYRLLSSYGKNSDNHIWIITEADRSATTILFPSEY